MTEKGEEYHGPMPPGVKKIKRRKRESTQAFNLRKARIRRKAMEDERARREAAYAAEHPSDSPMAKFERVWNGDEHERVFK
jgi:hypothetical protein